MANITLRKESWENLISCIKKSPHLETEGNFWASVQSIERQLEVEIMAEDEDSAKTIAAEMEGVQVQVISDFDDVEVFEVFD